MTDQQNRRYGDNRIDRLEDKIEELSRGHNEIMVKLRSIEETAARYRGFIGGVAFVFTGVGTVIAWFHQYFSDHWK